MEQNNGYPYAYQGNSGFGNQQNFAGQPSYGGPYYPPGGPQPPKKSNTGLVVLLVVLSVLIVGLGVVAAVIGFSGNHRNTSVDVPDTYEPYAGLEEMQSSLNDVLVGSTDISDLNALEYPQAEKLRGGVKAITPPENSMESFNAVYTVLQNCYKPTRPIPNAARIVALEKMYVLNRDSMDDSGSTKAAEDLIDSFNGIVGYGPGDSMEIKAVSIHYYDVIDAAESRIGELDVAAVETEGSEFYVVGCVYTPDETQPSEEEAVDEAEEETEEETEEADNPDLEDPVQTAFFDKLYSSVWREEAPKGTLDFVFYEDGTLSMTCDGKFFYSVCDEYGTNTFTTTYSYENGQISFQFNEIEARFTIKDGDSEDTLSLVTVYDDFETSGVLERAE